MLRCKLNELAGLLPNSERRHKLPEVDETTLAQLSEGLEEATKQLESTRAAAGKHNEQVGSLLKRQETLETAQKKSKSFSETELAEIKKALKQHADELDAIVKRHTELVHQTRKGMMQIGSATDTSDQGWVTRVSGRPVIFESKRQAEELGWFLLATMPASRPVKGRAQQWLKEQGLGGQLHYIPTFPSELVQICGQSWFEACQKVAKGVPVGETMTGGSTPGSVLTRPEFSNALIRNVENYGTFRANAQIWPMPTDTVYIPRRTAGLTVYWEGEEEAATASDLTLQLVGMTAKKMFGMYQCSSELMEDAVIHLAALIMMEFALAFAKEEDRIGWNGDGTGGQSPGFAGYVGVLGAPASGTPATADSTMVPHMITGAATADLSTEVTQQKLRAMCGVLPDWADDGARWFLSKSFLADISGITLGTAGGPVVDFSKPLPTQMFGYPITLVNQMPAASTISESTKCLALGNLMRSWILGDRRAVTMRTSMDYAINTDQITIVGTNRVAFLMGHGNGMVIYKTGTAS